MQAYDWTIDHRDSKNSDQTVWMSLGCTHSELKAINTVNIKISGQAI